MNIQQFNYNVNLLQAVLWQYDESTNLLSLINQKQQWYNQYQTKFWEDWYDNVFNILTANQFGLSVWSYILNVPLFLDNVPEDPNKPIWGFNQIISFPTLENTYLNFNNGNFSTKNTVIDLTVEEQRFLLRLRYYQLCTNGVVGSIHQNGINTIGINEFLDYLCKTSNIDYTGTIYALDGLDMTMTYIITNSSFSQELFNAITTLDLFPRPTGVGIKVHIDYGFQFGFAQRIGDELNNNNKNFGNGNFIEPFVTTLNY